MLDKTPGSVAALQYETVPGGQQAGYCEAIYDVVEKHNVRVIVPLTDPELTMLAWAEHDLRKKGCRVMISPFKDLTLALDKGVLYESLPDISPRGAHCTNVAELRSFIDDFSDGESCFVKLRTAHGSRGTKKLIPTDQWLDNFGTHKPEAFGFTFPLGMANELFDQFELIALETLPGAEYSIDCLFGHDGQLVFYGARERETTRNGICSTARFVVDRDHEFREFIDQVSDFVTFRYNINIQAKRDREGKLKLLEINPRISGSLGSFLPAGYNLARAGVEMLLDPTHVPFEVQTPTEYVYPRSFRVSHFI
jgi:hypothetical protein